MPFQWTEKLAVGVAEIDAQHRELLDRVARLDVAARAHDLGEVARVLAYLHEYALRHFELEERIMRDRGYPALAEHRSEHEAFAVRLVKLQRDFERDGASALMTLRLQNLLGEWLEDHFAGPDQRLGRFLAGAVRPGDGG
jgi:hemerythrin